jgi:hypothetical protein
MYHYREKEDENKEDKCHSTNDALKTTHPAESGIADVRMRRSDSEVIFF